MRVAEGRVCGRRGVSRMIYWEGFGNCVVPLCSANYTGSRLTAGLGLRRVLEYAAKAEALCVVNTKRKNTFGQVFFLNFVFVNCRESFEWWLVGKNNS